MEDNSFVPLDEDSIKFLQKRQGLLNSNYQASDSRNFSLTLDGLIANEYQIPPHRLIYFKESIAHLKLLLSLSTEDEIKSFHKKIQGEKIINSNNADHKEIEKVLNQFLVKSNKDQIKPSPKINLEYVMSMKQMTSESMNNNYEILNNTKEEYLYLKEKVETQSDRLKIKVKEKHLIGNEVAKINGQKEETGKLSRSLAARKSKLLYLKKRINLYVKQFEFEKKKKTKKIVSNSDLEKEKARYKQLVEDFHNQKIEAENIFNKVKKFSVKKKEVLKKQSYILTEALLLEEGFKGDNAYKETLKEEIKSLSKRVEKQESELECLDRIIETYSNSESIISSNLGHTRRFLDNQNKVFSRHNHNKKNYDFNGDKPENGFSDIKIEAEKLCGELEATHHNNINIFKRVDSLAVRIAEEKKKFEKLKNSVSESLMPKKAIRLRKENSKNREELTKLKIDFDELEEEITRAREEKDAKLFSLKEYGEKHDTLTGKWRIFTRFTRERIINSEKQLMELYGELIGLGIDLATNYKLFEISSTINNQLLKNFSNIYFEIKSLRKDVLREIDKGRGILEKEESHLDIRINEQYKIQQRYKEFCDKFQGVLVDRDEIDALIYQNADLERKLEDNSSGNTAKNEVNTQIEKSLEDVKAVVGNSLSDDKKNRPKISWSRFLPGFLNVESSPTIQTGAIIILALSGFSYFLIYNSGVRDYATASAVYNLSDNKPGKKIINGNLKRVPTIADFNERIDMFNEYNYQELISPVKVNILQNNLLNKTPVSLFSESKLAIMNANEPEIEKISAIWSNYADIFADLRFDNPVRAFRLFEVVMNRQALDLTLLDSIQLLYSIKRILQSEEGPFFNRLFKDFVNLGINKKDAALYIMHNNKLIDKIYRDDLKYIFKGEIRPIDILEKADMEKFEEMIVPYIIKNYKIFARIKKISVPKNIREYAVNLAQDIYVCAKKFHVPVTSLVTIAHQESFFVNLLGDSGKSASPFQIYQPTKMLILEDLRKDGFKAPAKVDSLENHLALATFMAAYHFADLMGRHANTIVDPLTHRPSTLIVNLKKSSRSYNGGKPYAKKVFLKQLQLESYLKKRQNNIS